MNRNGSITENVMNAMILVKNMREMSYKRKSKRTRAAWHGGERS